MASGVVTVALMFAIGASSAKRTATLRAATDIVNASDPGLTFEATN